MALALDGWREPFVAAFFYHYGKHPDKPIPERLERDRKHKRLDIPDYDPAFGGRLIAWVFTYWNIWSAPPR